MIKTVLNRGKLYWICVSITAALCYGFTLTNFSVGVDDERFKIFSTRGEWAAQGRWGSYVTKYLFNSYEFLPFWRDFIAVLLMIFGVTLWCYFIQKYSNDFFNKNSLIVFACVAISFPYIASAFILEMLTIEIGLIFALSALSLLFAAKFFIKASENDLPKHTWKYLIVSILLLTYAISFYETSCSFFLTGIFILCIILSSTSSNKNEYSTKKCIGIFFSLIFVLLASIILWKIIGVLVVKTLSMQMSGYTNHMIAYDKNNLFQSFITFVPNWFKMLIQNAATDMADFTFIFSTVVVIAISTYLSIKNKKWIILLFGIGCVLSAQSMYFLTGYLWLAKRSLYSMCVLTGFACALLFAVLENVHVGKLKLRNVVAFVMVLIVFYQSKSLNQVFFTDYLRYQMDISTMNTIALEIEKTQSENTKKPVAFVGALNEYNLKLGDIEGHTLFMWDRIYTVDQELASVRIFDFMNMHGYNIQKAENVNPEKLKKQILDMPTYPRNGYVKDCGDYIIVKIGKSQLEKIK